MTQGGRISDQLLEVLQCPVGKSPLRQEGQQLLCSCGLAFPIVDEIPVLLADRARLPAGVHTLAELPCNRATSPK